MTRLEKLLVLDAALVQLEGFEGELGDLPSQLQSKLEAAVEAECKRVNVELEPFGKFAAYQQAACQKLAESPALFGDY